MLGMRYPGVEESLAEMSRVNAAIDASLTRLDGRLSVLRGSWTGEASDAYEQARREWTASIARRNRMLDRIRRSGTGIVDAHRDASDAVHRIWGAR
ncbi:MAG TPA: WXG100 family type VII secretion target [Cellulomonas sp.]